MKKRRRIIIKNDKVKFKNNYNRRAYKIGSRITSAQVAHRIGFYDERTNILFYDQKLDQDAWLWLVNKVKNSLDLSPANAALYVNKIYKVKLKRKDNYLKFISNLRNTCGKLFSVVPSAINA